jgi:voltage-gated potassium channel
MKSGDARYIVLAAALVLYAIAVALTLSEGVDLKTAIIWNLLASLYIYYSLIQANIVSSPAILIASLMDAFVFALLTVFLAGWFMGIIRRINVSEYISSIRIKRLRGHVIIAPYNNFSKTLAEEMQKKKIKFVVMAENPLQVANLYSKHMLAIVGGIKNKESFKVAGLNNAKHIVACGDTDIENALIAITSKDINPNIKIISRVIEEDNIKKLDKAGASLIVIPGITAGESISSEIAKRVL